MSKSVTGHEKEESESHEIEYTRTTRATHMARIIYVVNHGKQKPGR